MILLWIFQLCAGYLLVPEGGERGRQWRSLAVEADDEHLRFNHPSADKPTCSFTGPDANVTRQRHENARGARTERLARPRRQSRRCTPDSGNQS